MPDAEQSFSMMVASIEILQVECFENAKGQVHAQATAEDLSNTGSNFSVSLKIRKKTGGEMELSSEASSREAGLAGLLAQLCIRPVTVSFTEIENRSEKPLKIIVAVREVSQAEKSSDGEIASKRTTKDLRAGVGRYVSAPDRSDDLHLGLVIASLRAASHAGLLKADYRANNQKTFRAWSKELCRDVIEALELPEEVNELERLEAEGIILEQLNRVASAAVVTAANYPRPDSVLSLFDTSAWLFDSQGRRRDAYTDTDLWLAWYPGIENDDRTVDEVIETMPQSPPTKIPFVVRVFENPKSWIRFRGAVDLEDHDVMHALLGRGLQDQDEAFVLGFAMGTGKKVSWFQYHIFKFVLAWLYPEPYRIPKYLQPAFDLGFQCGKETGEKDLYKQNLKDLRTLNLREAREKAGIEMTVLRRYYELEQQQIPFTIASLRLP
ncbi:MAG: hypothetical protein AAF483_27755 [Planctomycetota bacterium]